MNPTPTAVISAGEVVRCAICHQALDPARDMVLFSIVARPAGSLAPTEYRVYACNSAHAAEALRRTAAVIDQHQLAMPIPGGMAWPQQHGVLVGAKAKGD